MTEPLKLGPSLIDADAVGSTNDTAVLSSVDLVSSFLALAGVGGPADLDGEDLGETLLGRRSDTRQAPLYWVRPPDRPGPKNDDWPDLAVRQGPWKLLINSDGSSPQLYNVDHDPAETDDVSQRHPETCARLKDLVTKWNREPTPSR